jgi:pSer/pThr/pTyr-binding forkhead associated (FHA) protein
MTVEGNTGEFSSRARLVLDLEQSEYREVTVNESEDVTLGRVDRFTSVLPDVNLTRIGGWECGVSRLHAAIRLENGKLYLVDLDSTNGTFLNGKRLPPGGTKLLRNGDRVRLGIFRIRVHFAGDA